MLLECKDISLTYVSKKTEIDVLDKISFNVEKGDFISIVGPSGCGKTTLLKIIAGLTKYTTGKIIMSNKFEVGYVFQDSTLLMWKNVIENVSLPLQIKKIDKQEALNKSKSILKMMDLEGFEEEYPNNLSGGMKHRVAIARSLVYDPDIILMDEPFGALDEPTRMRLNIELNNLWRKTKKTIIFVTHNISEAVFLSNKIIILSKRPAKIKEIIDVNFSKNRKIDLLDTEDYIKLVLKIRKIFD